MKKLHKKILPLLSASFCLISKQKESFYLEKSQKEISIEAKLEETSKNAIRSLELENFISELNKTEVHLIVTKADKNILVLLHPEDRYNSEQSAINNRHTKFLFNTSRTESKKSLNGHYKGFNYFKLLKSNLHKLKAKAFRNAKSYYIDNQGGYKSICPVFFEKISAEEFLLKTSKENLKASRQPLALKINKNLLKGIVESKIITVGLGDFIDYYCSNTKSESLDKLEFLFFPSSKELNSQTKLLNLITKKVPKTKTFNFYNKKYQNLKVINEKT